MEVSRVGIEGLDLLLHGLDEMGVLMTYVSDIVASVEVAVAEIVTEAGFGAG